VCVCVCVCVRESEGIAYSPCMYNALVYIFSGRNGYDDRVGGCVCVRDVYIICVREDAAKEMNSSDTSPFRVRHCHRVGLRALKG